MRKRRPPGHPAFGQAVRTLRLEKDLSQEDLGYAAGLHRNYIGGVERGDLNPTLISIEKIAAALDVKASELLDLAESLR